LLGDAAEFSILDVQNFPIKRTWYMVYPAGKQLSIIGQTYYQYLLDAAQKITEQGGLIPDYNYSLITPHP
jgi:hypothetical protein